MSHRGVILVLVVTIALVVGACSPAAPGAPATPRAATPGAATPGGAAEPPAAASPTDAGTGQLEPFTFVLDFHPGGYHSGYFIALEKGWYEEEGLDVEFLTSAGSGDAVKRVAAGEGDAGAADFSAIVAAIANDDAQVIAIAQLMRRPPHSIFARADRGIEEASDLAGKTIATSAGNSNQILFPLFAENVGIDPESVTWMVVDGASIGSAVLSGQADAGTYFIGNRAQVDPEAETQGVELQWFPYAEFGLEIYSVAILAHKDKIDSNADRLTRFLRASLRGLAYVYESAEHAQEASQAIKDRFPQVSYDAVLGETALFEPYFMTDEVVSGTVELGHFEPERVQLTRDVFVQYLELGDVATEDLYSERVLP